MHGTASDALERSASPGPGNPATGSAATDEQLMVAFARGSQDAFTELFSRYKQPLYGFFHRRLADPIYADELTQDTFVAILRASTRYQPAALFRTYLYAIAFKILRTHRRKMAFRATFFGANSSHREPSVQSTAEPDLLLRDAVAKLDARDREVLLLREFEQLTYTEIAELINLPVNTVRSRLFRARTALRGLLTAPAPKLAPNLTQSQNAQPPAKEPA
jgi:RNA polymerase sigma-70 factor (ECF subfamily)